MQDRIIESGPKYGLQIRVAMWLEQAWDKKIIKTKEKGGQGPLLQLKITIGRAFSTLTPRTTIKERGGKRRRRGGDGIGSATAMRTPAQHLLSNSFVAGKGRERRREIDRTKERERKWGARQQRR